VDALSAADCVAVKVPEPHDMVPADERLDAERVVADLRARGVDARSDAEVDRLISAVADGARGGDVVLVMSNGAFGGFIDRLLAALRSKITMR
jgi:UDP-N-acetylmuramate: L-alanyl-gamma-D-glutamyl-meso-diaminopimelate ligase